MKVATDQYIFFLHTMPDTAISHGVGIITISTHNPPFMLDRTF